jgi:hypothetical protein
MFRMCKLLHPSPHKLNILGRCLGPVTTVLLPGFLSPQSVFWSIIKRDVVCGEFHNCVSLSYFVKLSVLNGDKGKGDYGTFISKDMEDRSCNLILDLISVVRSFLKFLSLSSPIYLPYLKIGHDLFLALDILLFDKLSSYSFQIFSFLGSIRRMCLHS